MRRMQALKFIFRLLLCYMYDFVDKLKKENNPFTSKITSYSKREVSCMYSGTHSTQKKETQRYIKFCLTEKLIETKNY